MASRINPEKVQRIAIRLTNWVGDCVMNTPFLARTRQTFPNARIVALGRGNVTSLLQNHPDIDEAWTIADQSAAGFMDAARRLRKFKPDLGFLLPNSIKVAMLFRAGRVPEIVGYSRDGRRPFLTHAVKLRPEDLAVHEVQYYLRLLHRWEHTYRDPPPLKLVVTDHEKSTMGDWLSQHSIDTDRMIVGVNPAAFFGTAKRWLPERFAESARHFVEKHDAQVVVTGLESERDVAQQVCDAGGKNFINGAGRMNLRELMAFIFLSNLFFTNDSGAMHIAAALGTPLVAIFGSTDWVTTAPLGPNSVVVRADTPCAPCILRHCPIDHRCMTGVSSAMVIDAAEELLANQGVGI